MSQLKETEPVIKVEGLVRQFGHFTAVNNISFDVKPGEIFGFLGANGAGKTTAIRILCGLLSPTSGKVNVAGFDVTSQTELVKRNIGYMSQRFSLYSDLTVFENLRFYGGVYGLSKQEINERADALLQKLGFEDLRNTLISSIPLGWKQKLSFSLALFHRPKIVFLDEPTGGVRPHYTSTILGTYIRSRSFRHNRLCNKRITWTKPNIATAFQLWLMEKLLLLEIRKSLRMNTIQPLWTKFL